MFDMPDFRRFFRVNLAEVDLLKFARQDRATVPCTAYPKAEMEIHVPGMPTRRAVAFSGVALALLPLLGACAGLRRNEGGSSHAGRRPDGVKPLDFDPQEGLAAINKARRKLFLQPFEADERLQQAAQNHADYLARTGKFGHEFGGETQFPRRIAAVGFEGSAGENLGVGYGSIEEAIEGWLESPKHRVIFTRRNYNRGGIAYAFNISGQNPRYTHYWVMIVGANPPPGMRMGPMVRRI